MEFNFLGVTSLVVLAIFVYGFVMTKKKNLAKTKQANMEKQ